MTDEEKTRRIHIFTTAIRVLNRQIVNLQYQLAQFADSASFIHNNEIEKLIEHRSQLDGDLYAATQVIENEHK